METNHRRASDQAPWQGAGPDGIRQLAAFSEIGKALTSTLDLKEILAVVLEKISSCFEPKDWALLLVDEDRNDLRYEIAVGEHADDIRDLRPKIGEGTAGLAAESGLTLVVPDVASDPRFSRERDALYSFVTGPLVSVPLKTRGKTLGVIELYNVNSAHLDSKEEMLLLTTIADYTAIAIENALLFNRVHELTVTDDLTLLHNSRYFQHTI